MWLFTAKSPVDDETRQWIDDSFRWFIGELGLEILMGVDVILPTEDFFPDPFDGSRPSIRRMVDRVCSYMDVEPESVVIRFHENEDEAQIHPLATNEGMRGHVLGSYQMGGDRKFHISLNITQTSSPEMLVATIAHELGHVILLGEDRLDPEYEYHEPLTDLLTVFYGLGVFNANSAVVFEQWTNPQFLGWRIVGAGYLTEEAFGYGLALFAALRGETKPAWSKFLTTNVRSHFKSSARYLAGNGDSVVESIRKSVREPSETP